MKKLIALCLALPVAASMFVFTGCEGDSAETIVREVGLRVDGYYWNGGPPITLNNSGARVTAMNLRQTGDQLEGVDNNGLIFKGTIGNAGDSMATFTLEGKTTIGSDVTISGTITVPAGTSDATMQGTWIEPTLTSPLYAKATVPLNTSNAPPATNTNTFSNLTWLTKSKLDLAQQIRPTCVWAIL